jgi:LmbE family N-acetylglucosaminyl deacetylase
VFAHPDDESLSCGGTLARCAELGARVTLLCATRGEDAAGESGDRDAVRRRRTEELAKAADVLGVGATIVLDYPDGELPWLAPAASAALQADIRDAIRKTDADVVITFGEDGLYWHPDHITLHEITTAAVAELAGRSPALYYVTMPPGAVRAIVENAERRAGGRPGHRMVLGIDDPDAFGVLASAPTLVIDVRRSAARKLDALRCHGSQIRDGGALTYIQPVDAPALLGVEHFHRAAVGAAGPTFLDDLGQAGG